MFMFNERDRATGGGRPNCAACFCHGENFQERAGFGRRKPMIFFPFGISKIFKLASRQSFFKTTLF